MDAVFCLLASVSSQIHVPIKDTGVGTPLSYHGVVQFGTQKQPLTIIFDTGSYVFWVRDAGCNPLESMCTGNPYNSTLSTTYEGPGSKINTITYGDGSKVGGNTAKDTITVSGISVAEQDFVQANLFTQAMPGLDGIMGLSASQPDQNIFYRNLLKQKLISSPVFSYYIDYGDSAGGITFGAIDTARYGGDLLWAPIVTDQKKLKKGNVAVEWLGDILNTFSGKPVSKKKSEWMHWNLELANLTIGTTDMKIPPGFSILPDTGASLAVFPTEEATLINFALGMNPTGNEDQFTIPCSSVSKLPNITFHLVTGALVLTPQDYTYMKGSVCMSGISGGSPSKKQIVFGNVLL